MFNIVRNVDILYQKELIDVVNSILCHPFAAWCWRGVCLWSAVSNMGANMWICKPSGLSQGRAIVLLKNWEDMTAFRLKLQNMEDCQASKRTLQRQPQPQPQPYIVQQYVNSIWLSIINNCFRFYMFSLYRAINPIFECLERICAVNMQLAWPQVEWALYSSDQSGAAKNSRHESQMTHGSDRPFHAINYKQWSLKIRTAM